MVKSYKITGKPNSISIFLIKKYSFIRFSVNHDVIVAGWFHWMFLEEIFRRDPLAQLGTFSFVFKLLQYFEKVLRKLSPRKIVPSPNSNANPIPNPDPDRGAIFLGGNFPNTF